MYVDIMAEVSGCSLPQAAEIPKGYRRGTITGESQMPLSYRMKAVKWWGKQIRMQRSAIQGWETTPDFAIATP